MPLLELRGVAARYGGLQALRGIDLSVDEGEIVAVLGANGAGKTTTLRAISATVKTSGDLQVFPGSFLVVAGADQRFVVGLVDKAGRLVTNADVRLAFGRNESELRAAPALPAAFHVDGIPTKPYYEVTTRFAASGKWYVAARVGADTALQAFDVRDAASVRTPVAGRPLTSVPTPTTADHMGVEPICTRQPVCPLHDVSLDKALASGKPTALLIATPALCQSRTCGPVLEVLLSVRDEFAGRVQMVHAEVFRDLSGRQETPIMGAYALENEPVLFLARPDGVVQTVLDGPYDRVEARASLTRLVS